jgi:hypothetical protein
MKAESSVDLGKAVMVISTADERIKYRLSTISRVSIKDKLSRKCGAVKTPDLLIWVLRTSNSKLLVGVLGSAGDRVPPYVRNLRFHASAERFPEISTTSEYRLVPGEVAYRCRS